ncbi:RagB/SusD family nutrient uptake outer membrane protein [Chitinophaga agrisoli]|uniref:RagB/SusD family nutrient uptake outer membrane protein n=1 Tax=Chitinophaga agrisoli TaxID=2607653 RepID=A0A5B2VRB2_9BACT|nr:RagB/SusD family nutrient uptake outer membrane protein [Chitinophaga agrisoli]KAA2241751.1 RagB/SusD family nutrient uptake outer membrane protein [Chitinophaga agrisoli]
MSAIQHNMKKAGLLVCWLFIISSCTKFVEIDPPKTETIVGPKVFTNDVDATGAVIGVYGEMIHSSGFAGGYTQSITFLSALSADELTNYSGQSVPRQFYENAISVNNAAIERSLWNEGYRYIYAANRVLRGLQTSSGVSAATKSQLIGEAQFIRAFCHFYLVNLFGAVPLITSTDYEVNMIKPRTSVDSVYKQIIADLRNAQSLLRNDYVDGQKVRPNKATATAFLARVYLYRKDWANAGQQASLLINDPAYRLNDTLNEVFLQNSAEAIWQLVPNMPTYNTWEGANFILTAAPAVSSVNATALSPELLAAFEPGDLRRTNWVDSITVDTNQYFFPYKYKVKRSDYLTEYSMVLRLAEQYLIRAEARAQRGNFLGARSDLNMLRRRAGLPPAIANTLAAMLRAITHERQVELFTEWGHRWLDLKRTNTAAAVLSHIKPAWKNTAVLYPLPQNELAKNPLLGAQNEGY